MADYLPKFKPGQAITLSVSADVVGGRLVVATTSKAVGPAGADSALVVGVAAFDAVTGEKVTVFPRPTGVHQLTASAAIAVGAKVISAATGKVATAGASLNFIGIALEAAAADLDVIDVLFI